MRMTRRICDSPFGSLASCMFAPASCLRGPSTAGAQIVERSEFFEVSSREARSEFAHFDRRPLRCRAFLGDRNRLVLGLASEQVVAADHFLRLGKRPIDAHRFAATHLHAYALGFRAQRLARAEQPARLELRRVFEHARITRLTFGFAGGAALTDGFDNHQHVRHTCSPLMRTMYCPQCAGRNAKAAVLRCTSAAAMAADMRLASGAARCYAAAACASLHSSSDMIA